MASEARRPVRAEDVRGQSRMATIRHEARGARIAAWATRAAQPASGPARDGRKRRRREPL